jgi:hypothetical protein
LLVNAVNSTITKTSPLLGISTAQRHAVLGLELNVLAHGCLLQLQPRRACLRLSRDAFDPTGS